MWNKLANKEEVEKTIAALKANGIDAIFVQSGEEAKEKALALIPKDKEVLTMTSVTLDTLGIAQEINESGKYNSVRTKLNSMDQKTQSLEMQQLGSAPEYAIGSAHAVTQDGHIIIASNTGSQLPAYAYGTVHLIFVIGAQKIVKDTDAGMKRVYDYVLKLESERAHNAYGVPGSAVNKLLIINKEIMPGRITMIIVNQSLGF